MFRQQVGGIVIKTSPTYTEGRAGLLLKKGLCSQFIFPTTKALTKKIIYNYVETRTQVTRSGMAANLTQEKQHNPSEEEMKILPGNHFENLQNANIGRM